MSASHSKLHDFTGYKDAEFKIPFKQTDSIYLTKNEIQKIYDLDITEELLKKNGYQKKFKSTIKSLNEERDRFLLGCFTALRHSDYSRLDEFISKMISFEYGR
ncbi:hypothetical protein OCV73_12695 [Barnesiella propionica]|uniref:hypothetical protein n=1 Tax=Barnesiella propionica TaxID=2981781 RepID=UPI0011CAA0F6|nr:hypothetical protein [Barnesiella propionica]MCU6769798.1 hypothetical protein [Barnesiella propionica]